MQPFLTPTPKMKTKIERRPLFAIVTITASESLHLVTTAQRDIKPGDEKIEILKRRLINVSTARA